MVSDWKVSVRNALIRYAANNATVQIIRTEFLAQELVHIVSEANSSGKTPSQTVSRVLQELRDENFLFFSSNGCYVLNVVPIHAESEDLPQDVLENAVEQDRLILADVMVSSETSMNRIRKGTLALRNRTLQNYRYCCALCDISDTKLLVTSHIARWADRPEARGLLSNTICFCTLHDKLYECGYFALNADTHLIWKHRLGSETIGLWRARCTGNFKLPEFKKPDSIYLEEHRKRVGL